MNKHELFVLLYILSTHAAVMLVLLSKAGAGAPPYFY
jgi:hypothetical protein